MFSGSLVLPGHHMYRTQKKSDHAVVHRSGSVFEMIKLTWTYPSPLLSHSYCTLVRLSSFSSFLTSLYNSSWIYICDTVASWDGEVPKTKSSLSDVANNLLVLEVGVRIGYCYWVTHFLSVFNAIVASLKSLMSRSITTVLTLIMWTRFIICYAAYWLYCSVKYCWSSSALQTTV